MDHQHQHVHHAAFPQHMERKYTHVCVLARWKQENKVCSGTHTLCPDWSRFQQVLVVLLTCLFNPFHTAGNFAGEYVNRRARPLSACAHNPGLERFASTSSLERPLLSSLQRSESLGLSLCCVYRSKRAVASQAILLSINLFLVLCCAHVCSQVCSCKFKCLSCTTRRTRALLISALTPDHN